LSDDKSQLVKTRAKSFRKRKLASKFKATTSNWEKDAEIVGISLGTEGNWLFDLKWPDGHITLAHPLEDVGARCPQKARKSALVSRRNANFTYVADWVLCGQFNAGVVTGAVTRFWVMKRPNDLFIAELLDI
jgi:hypothetical protein